MGASVLQESRSTGKLQEIAELNGSRLVLIHPQKYLLCLNLRLLHFSAHSGLLSFAFDFWSVGDFVLRNTIALFGAYLADILLLIYNRVATLHCENQTYNLSKPKLSLMCFYHVFENSIVSYKMFMTTSHVLCYWRSNLRGRTEERTSCAPEASGKLAATMSSYSSVQISFKENPLLVIPCFKLAWGISAINVWDSHFLITNVIRLFIRLGRRVHKIVLYSIIQSHSFHKMISFRHGVCAVLNSAQLPLTPFLTISFNNSEIWVRTSLPEIASARTPSVARLRSFWQAKSSKRVTS